MMNFVKLTLLNFLCTIAFVVSLNGAVTASETTCDLTFENSKICGRVVWDHPILVGKDSPFTIHFTILTEGNEEEVEATLNSDEVSALLWMPSMNHGSAPLRLKFLNPSTLYVDKVYFTMRGVWEIRFKMKRSVEVSDYVAIKVNL